MRSRGNEAPLLRDEPPIGPWRPFRSSAQADVAAGRRLRRGQCLLIRWRMNRARNPPPSRKPPSNSPSQWASCAGSAREDHRPSMLVSKRSSMCTMPLPSA